MKTLSAVLLAAASAVILAGQSTVPGYQLNREFGLTAAGAMENVLGGFDNPAVLNYLHQPDIFFTWIDTSGRVVRFDRWGLFLAGPRFGFGIVRSPALVDYRISSSFGSRQLGFGLGFGWSSGEVETNNRASAVSLGALYRPGRHFSLGMNGLFALTGGGREGTAELALRPLGNEIVTFFGDYSLRRGVDFKDGLYTAGLALEPLPGIRLTGRYFNDRSFSAGLHLSFGRGGIQSLVHFNEDGNAVQSAYGVRAGGLDRSVLNPATRKGSAYLKLDLNGPLRYQRFVMFDNANTLKDLLEAVKAAQEDKAVAGIAINTSGMQANIEMLWELRTQLAAFKSAGKRVVVFIDNVTTVGYYFASVADRIVMDPLGMIDLRGLMMGRTFLKGSLDKLGIGFDEWRFFKYKSAVESFSRDNMSDADREQRQAIIDDIYDLIRAGVASDRGLTVTRFDELVNNTAFFMAATALDNGLVDTLERWSAAEGIVKALAGGEKTFINADQLSCYNLPTDNRWGDKPKIALIYGLGVCAMDEGITARQLVKDVEAATRDKSVKAVVFRVDSPGGDALASDVVAEAIKKCAEKKCVVVSQGLVAGSGGYWLSMYGTRIIAAPVTITGSIGVIGAWIYDQGIKTRLGLTTDKVQIGKHADLEFGATLPFLGLSIPDRNLTAEERLRMETEIRSMYAGFVGKVAGARKKSFAEIEAISQGRIWSGIDGKEVGIVDELGNLNYAIDRAKEIAGIGSRVPVEIVEYPKPRFLNPEMFRPRLVALDEDLQSKIGWVKFYADHNGQPVPILPLEYLEPTIE